MMYINENLTVSGWKLKLEMVGGNRVRVAVGVPIKTLIFGHLKEWSLTAASTFAGLSSFGSANMDMTEIRIVSTVCTGSHLSDAFS